MLLLKIGWGLREHEQVEQFSSFVMIFNLVHINLSGTDVLGWCVVELFRCVRDILTGGEIRASCVTLYFTSCCEIRGYKYGWRNSGWTTMKAMCVFGCLKLDWSFTTCVAVGLDVACYFMFEEWWCCPRWKSMNCAG